MKNIPIEHCEDMQAVRRHIDAIDAQLLPLIALRSEFVAQAARIKQSSHEIIDEARIETIIARVREMALAQGLSPDIAERTWRALIAASIDFEREQFFQLGKT